MSKRRIIRFLCWSDRLSRSCWRNWTQAPFHVCLWTAYWAPWPSMAVPAFCCWTIWNDCLQGQQKLLFYSSLWFFFFSHSSCGFSRFPAEKLIKQKLAFGPTGTEKLNRFLYSSHTTWFYKLRNMWFNLCCLIATVLPTIPLQDGEVSSSDGRSSTTCRCEATPSPDECCWWTPRKWHASSTARRHVHPSSPTWCHRCPPYAASYATHAHEATSSWWSMIL